MSSKKRRALRHRIKKNKPQMPSQAEQLQAMNEVLQKMVEVRLGSWFKAALLTLRDEFGFDEAQLSQFSRVFRDKLQERDEQAQAQT